MSYSSYQESHSSSGLREVLWDAGRVILMVLGCMFLFGTIGFYVSGGSSTQDKQTVVQWLSEVAPDHEPNGLYECFTRKGERPLVLGRNCAFVVTSEGWEPAPLPPAVKWVMDCTNPYILKTEGGDKGNRVFCLDPNIP